MQNASERQILDKAGIRRALKKMAAEIVLSNPDLARVAFVGILKRGVPLAERMASFIEESEGAKVPVGILDITLYRDDIGLAHPNPVVRPTELPFELKGLTIILVDDVLYTGRTVRAALDAIMDFGRPSAIRLAVLIDRGLRELPVRADFVGKKITTTGDEDVLVQLEDVEARDRVLVRRVPSEERPRSPEE